MEEQHINQITGKIIRAYYNVYNNLGYGFLEKVYERAMIIELPKVGLHGRSQVPIHVFYDELEVGVYVSDIVVENCVMVELKAVEVLHDQHEAQLLNYLKATKIEYGLLLNFGPKPEIKRKIFENKYK